MSSRAHCGVAPKCLYYLTDSCDCQCKSCKDNTNPRQPEQPLSKTMKPQAKLERFDLVAHLGSQRRKAQQARKSQQDKDS